jgi:hypothetical protein
MELAKSKILTHLRGLALRATAPAREGACRLRRRIHLSMLLMKREAKLQIEIRPISVANIVFRRGGCQELKAKFLAD